MMMQQLRNHRMHAQRLVGNPFDSPQAMVRWHLAVQSQDYPGASWGIAQRCDGVRATDIDRLFNDGAILRTHVMRPTWHFVLPEDIRWLLALTGPRVHAGSRGRYRELELDDTTLPRSAEIIGAALAGGTFLTRNELAAVLRDGGIGTDGQRMAYMLMHAEVHGVICSGPRKGKQFTYALLDECVPPSPPLDRDEALARIARRYLESHGPATPHDLAWWSGLTVTDARRGIEMNRDVLEQVTIDETTWWFVPPLESPDVRSPLVHLLPNYDEYFIGFRNREVVFDPEVHRRFTTTREYWQAHLVALDGQIVGGWRRTLTSRQVTISPYLPSDLDADEIAALDTAAGGYGRFLGLEVVVDG